MMHLKFSTNSLKGVLINSTACLKNVLRNVLVPWLTNHFGAERVKSSARLDTSAFGPKDDEELLSDFRLTLCF